MAKYFNAPIMLEKTKRIASYFLHHATQLPKEAEILSVYEQNGRLKIDVIEDSSLPYDIRFFTVCDTTSTVVPAGAWLVGVAVLGDGSRSYLFEVPHDSSK